MGRKDVRFIRGVRNAENPRDGRAPDVVRSDTESSKTSLDRHVQNDMEQRFGHSFSNVRIHNDPAANDAADRLGAAAFTAGNDIHFGPGRYAPDTAAGRRLLAHELAHVVHASVVPTTVPGVAPESSASERGARALAESALHGGRQGTAARQAADGFGARYAVQPEKIITRGTEVHSGLVGAPGVGYQGPPIGAVHARTGEEIELPDGTRIPNVVALEYTGSLTPDSHWLQFVWFEMVATTPKGVASATGSIPTSSGNLPFTTNPAAPSWAVDSGPGNPFYEAGAANLRTLSTTTMFDAPGGGSAAPLANAMFGAGIGATSVRFVGHFSAFLIQRDQPMYEVDYTATTTFTRAGGSTVTSAIGYSVAGAPVSALPGKLRTLLHANYPGHKGIR